MSEERDHRAGLDANAQHRGRVTRKLFAEMDLHLGKGSI